MNDTHPPQGSIAARLKDIQRQIQQTLERCGRAPDSVTLVAVSKFHPLEAVLEAIRAGQRVFGENRVQEAQGKFTQLREDNPQVKLHIIGGLQRNKAREAVKIANVIESLDRPSLADTLCDVGEKLGFLPQFFIEVNTGDEEQKFGIPREKADQFIKQCQARFGDHIEGLMCIPPQGEDPKKHFRLLRKMAHEHGLNKLSMGMSKDFVQAIEEGATHVRIGTAIFGPRPQHL